jgi:hypothetical protein
MLPILLAVAGVAALGYYMKRAAPVEEPVMPRVFQPPYSRRIEFLEAGLGRPPFKGLVPAEEFPAEGEYVMPEVAAWMRFRIDPPTPPEDAKNYLSLIDQDDKRWSFQVLRSGTEFVALLPTGMPTRPEKLKFRYEPGLAVQDFDMPAVPPTRVQKLGPVTPGLSAEAMDQKLVVYVSIEKIDLPLYTMRIVRSERSGTVTGWRDHRPDFDPNRVAFEFGYPYAVHAGKVQVEAVGWRLTPIRKRIRLNNIRILKEGGTAYLEIPPEEAAVDLGDGAVLHFSSQPPDRDSTSDNANRTIVVDVVSAKDLRGRLRLLRPTPAEMEGLSLRFKTNRPTLVAGSRPTAPPKQGLAVTPKTLSFEFDVDVLVPVRVRSWKGLADVTASKTYFAPPPARTQVAR